MRLLTTLIILLLPSIALAAETKPAVDASNAFAADLYQRLTKPSDKNIFFSPSSISTALAMTSLGARGETEKQMQSVLRFDPASSPEAIHQANAELLKLINGNEADRGYQLSMANRLWGQKNYHFLPSFLDATKKYYGAPLEELNFSDSQAASTTIDDWVKKQSHDKIKDLISPDAITGQTRLILTNAVYFKGAWDHPFDKAMTKEERFHPAAALDVDLPMMNHQAKYRYAEDKTVQIVELPFAKKEIAMVILLPRDKEGPFDVEKGMTAKWLDETLALLKPREVKVAIPRFRMGGAFDLSSTLSNMGMPLAFTLGKADFSGITTQENLAISAVIHKAWSQVNEEGAEAAAATAVLMYAKAEYPNEPPAVFHADHSFIFLIRDTKTGLILFMGRILNPAK